MDSNSLAIISAILTLVGGKEIWSYFKRRAILKSAEAMKTQELLNAGEVVIKKELRELLDKQIEDLKTDLERARANSAELEKAMRADKEIITQLTVRTAVMEERLLNYTQKSRGKKQNESD